MTAISHERAQRFLVNQAVAAQADITATARMVMRQIVNGLLGTGSFVDKENASAAWSGHLVYRGSSDSVSANLGGTNLWDSDTDLVWASGASAHSWIVLGHPTLPWEMCIDLNSGTLATARVLLSASAGFTGGTTTARPTATDEFNMIAAGLGAWGIGLTNVANQWHIIASDDGKSVRVLFTRNGWGCALWTLDVPADPATGWSDPSACGITSSSTAAPTSTALTYSVWNAGVVQGVGLASAVIALQYTQAAGGSTSRLGQLSGALSLDNAFSSERAICPIGLVSVTASNAGYHGRICDLYGGPLQVDFGGGAAVVADGSWYGEVSGDEEWVQLGAVVLPWCKVPPSFGGGSPVYLGPAYIAASSRQSTSGNFIMQASDSVTHALYTWPASGFPDWPGSDYPGPNSPQNIAVAATLN